MSDQYQREVWSGEARASQRSHGLHYNGEKRLGWIPRDPAKPILRFGDHLFETDDFRTEAAVIPQHPIVDTWPLAGIVWPMDRNDQAGDCVVAGVDHALQAIAALLGIPRTNWTDAQILKYYQTQNPGFKSWADAGGPNDNGMVIQDFLSFLVKEGTILGFGLVDHTSEDQMKAAAYLGLANVTGETLDIAQQSQTTVWDYVKRSPVWGGHCTTTVAYGEQSGSKTDLFRLITWGEALEATNAFFAQQVGEVYFIITADLVAHPAFRAGYDVNSFASAFTSLTGKPFPVVTPTPTPTPTGGVSDANLAAAYDKYHAGMAALQDGLDQVVTAWRAGKA